MSANDNDRPAPLPPVRYPARAGSWLGNLLFRFLTPWLR